MGSTCFCSGGSPVGYEGFRLLFVQFDSCIAKPSGVLKVNGCHSRLQFPFRIGIIHLLCNYPGQRAAAQPRLLQCSYCNAVSLQAHTQFMQSTDTPFKHHLQALFFNLVRGQTKTQTTNGRFAKYKIQPTHQALGFRQLINQRKPSF